MMMETWVGFGTAGLICIGAMFRYLTVRRERKD